MNQESKTYKAHKTESASSSRSELEREAHGPVAGIWEAVLDWAGSEIGWKAFRLTSRACFGSMQGRKRKKEKERKAKAVIGMSNLSRRYLTSACSGKTLLLNVVCIMYLVT